MNKVVLAVLAGSALVLTAFTPAEASGGCGPYRHRGWDGFCRPGGQWGYHRPYVAMGYGYGWHRPWGPAWGWHRWHRWGGW